MLLFIFVSQVLYLEGKIYQPTLERQDFPTACKTLSNVLAHRPQQILSIIVRKFSTFHDHS
jgi:hypothetical protein